MRTAQDRRLAYEAYTNSSSVFERQLVAVNLDSVEQGYFHVSP